jgi:hypothetical protein
VNFVTRFLEHMRRKETHICASCLEIMQESEVAAHACKHPARMEIKEGEHPMNVFDGLTATEGKDWVAAVRELESKLARANMSNVRLIDAIRWVIGDIQYKAPEQIGPRLAQAWANKLSAVVQCEKDDLTMPEAITCVKIKWGGPGTKAEVSYVTEKKV